MKRLLGLLGLAALVAGCGIGADLDAERAGYRCTEDADCEAGRACVEGWCVVGELPVDVMTMDMDACPTGQLACAGGCVDVLSEPSNCGACGVSCGDGETCIGGRCACGDVLAGPTDEACLGAAECCNGSCVDVLRDAASCGSCDAPSCGVGQICESGSCVCDIGLGACDTANACTFDLLTDVDNCGACGVFCGTAACLGGQCSCGGNLCDLGETCCQVGGDDSTVCVDVLTSTNHCGACGNACGPGETCVGGTCECGGGAACTGGDVCCGGTCADPTSGACDCGGSPCADTCCGNDCVDVVGNDTNCGACGVRCGSAQSCVGGTCVCGNGLSACDDQCVDVLNDDNNCGVCGNACAGLCCNGACVDADSDAANCGACGVACGADEACAAGLCVDASPVVQIAAGLKTTCARRSSGSVLCWGDGEDGALGNGQQNDSAVPAEVVLPEPAVWIDTENGATCAVGMSGEVYCWGTSTVGRIGSPNFSDTPVPIGVTGAVTVAVGFSHVCAIRSDTTAVCWGSNVEGQMGSGNNAPETTNLPPIPVEDLDAVDGIAAGERVSLARDTFGRLYIWGNARNGQIPWDNGCGGQAEVEEPCQLSLNNIVSMALASRSAVAVDATGELWGFGRGDGDFLPPWIDEEEIGNWNRNDVLSVDAGEAHGCLIDIARSVWCWGKNSENQLGRQGNGDWDPQPVQGLSGTFIDLGLGSNHSCALRDDGVVFCWGRGNDGQLGNGQGNDSTMPVRVQGT